MPTVAVVLLLVAAARTAQAQGQLQVVSDRPAASEPIAVRAQFSQDWLEGDEYVGVLRGDVRLSQGPMQFGASEAVLWVRSADESGEAVTTVVAYMEGDVTIEQEAGSARQPAAFVELATTAGLQFESGERHSDVPSPQDPLYLRALARRESAREQPVGVPVEPAQYLINPGEPMPPPTLREVPPPVTGAPLDATPPAAVPLPGSAGQPAGPTPAMRRLRFAPRSAMAFQVDTFQVAGPAGPEQVVVVTGGVVILIDGDPRYGIVDIATDRLVLWTTATQAVNVTGSTLQDPNTPLELYLEGNVILRQGDRIVEARRIYYNYREQIALMIGADAYMPAPELGASIRVGAERVRQLSQDRFFARNAFVTTSTFGVPRYRIQASEVLFERRVAPVYNALTPQPAIDPETGMPRLTPWFTATDAVFYSDGLPLFYWPYLTGPAEDPGIPLRRASLHQDRIFGVYALTTWNMYKLLGIDDPLPNTEWDLNLDYYEERGLGFGTDFDYLGGELFGAPGPFRGFLESYFIDDQGLDVLGGRREDLPPETDFRGRALWRHLHTLPEGFVLRSEVGWLSDRNFLEQYFEHDFDEGKDYETFLQLIQSRDNWAWSVMAQGRINDFVTQTEHFPRGDVYWLGESLFDLFTYYTYSTASYSRLRVADAPPDPVRDPFTLLPWEVPANGYRAITRHELDLPFSLGPVRVVPYAAGDVAAWEEDLAGEQLQRAFGRIGLRGSVPFWRVFPTVHSDLFYLNGLAHKLLLEADYSYADSTTSLFDVPLYDPLDTDAQEAFRRRFNTLAFGGPAPLIYDERVYAFRTGLQNWITSPAPEIVDELHAARLAVRQRLQTRRGPVGDTRVVDWMTLDLESTYFPQDDRDNFGEPFGLLGYHYRWFLGDRTTFISRGLWDVYPDAQSAVSAGILLNRPARGNLYLEYRALDGPIDSDIATVSFAYQMSPKWAMSFSTGYDLAEERNVGQSLLLTRIGPDFLWYFGFNLDEGKDNLGFTFGIQPRFGPNLNLTSGALAPESLGATSRQ